MFVSLRNRVFASPEWGASLVLQHLLLGPTQEAVGQALRLDVSLLWLLSQP